MSVILTVCQHRVFVCFIWVVEQTKIISLNKTDLFLGAYAEKATVIFVMSARPPHGITLLLDGIS